MTKGTEDIAQALGALARIQTELQTIALRTDEQRRHDLIDLRRRLANQIAELGQISEPLFQSVEPSTAQEYRNRFSAMRSAAAIHQANWPAVRLGEDPAAFERSGSTVGEATRAFISWMRAMLPQLGNAGRPTA